MKGQLSRDVFLPLEACTAKKMREPQPHLVDVRESHTCDAGSDTHVTEKQVACNATGVTG